MNKKEIELAKRLEKISNEKELYGSIEDIEDIIQNKKGELFRKINKVWNLRNIKMKNTKIKSKSNWIEEFFAAIIGIVIGIIGTICVILLFPYLYDLIQKQTPGLPWFDVITGLILVFVLFLFFNWFISKTKKIWFNRTLLIMITVLCGGLIIIGNIPKVDFYSKFGILISLVAFSIPVAMVSLHYLFEIDSK